MKNIGLIGYGCIARSLSDMLSGDGQIAVRSVLVRNDRVHRLVPPNGALAVSEVGQISRDVELVVEVAGAAALRQHAIDVVSSGRDLLLVSSSALEDDAFREDLARTAKAAGRSVRVASGAIGGLDALGAAKAAGIKEVRYTGIKPPGAWRGTPAEKELDLDQLRDAAVFFEGNAREVARLYPKNANVAATLALGGVGFDETKVRLVADPGATENSHRIEIWSSAGQMRFEMTSSPLPGNPKSSALTAYSLLHALRIGGSEILV